VSTYVTGPMLDDVRLAAVGMVSAALQGDGEWLVFLGEQNAHRLPALTGTLTALAASVLRALDEDQREGVLSAWRTA
jgi:hypothetical protein